MDANELVLTEAEVPAGFKLRQSNTDPGQAQRVYAKSRFLKFGDAIWSEATVMRDEENARDGWTQLVELHNQRNDYDNAQKVRAALGDASYIHTGTMRGRPGLWAAVRIGLVIHRFNTYGVGKSESMEMLRQQVKKSR
jgi:hypothetical protein